MRLRTLVIACLVPAAAGAATPSSPRPAKLQLLMDSALDADCDGAAETGFATTRVLAPGQCIVYRTRYANAGDLPLRRLAIRTPVPRLTAYREGSAAHVVTPPGLDPGAVELPAEGQPGVVLWRFGGALGPGEAGELRFTVMLDPQARL